jgi:hypothetical protein
LALGVSALGVSALGVSAKTAMGRKSDLFLSRLNRPFAHSPVRLFAVSPRLLRLQSAISMAKRS